MWLPLMLRILSPIRKKRRYLSLKNLRYLKKRADRSPPTAPPAVLASSSRM